MPTTEELLASVPLFADLDERELSYLAKVTAIRDYKNGDVILKEGDPGVAFFIILSGEVEVVKGIGSESLRVLATLGTEHYFGELALLGHFVRTASVVAKRETQCLALPAWEFTATIKSNVDIAVKMLTALSRRLMMTDQAIMEIG